MNNSQQIANLIRLQTTLQKISVSKMLKEIGLGVNTLSNLDNGSMPKADNLGKIADYLGVSVDYLLGRTDNPETQMTTGDINGININGDTSIKINTSRISDLPFISKRDIELVQKINELDLVDYAEVISLINAKLG